MKNFNHLFILLLCLAFSTQNMAQRYLDEVFDEVQVEDSLSYGTNWTVLALPLVGMTIPEALAFDFYEPVGDTITERPLVILLHTGNFLPQLVNGGVYGERTDSSNVEIATRLAKMGYVVAAIDYRLGWNPLAQTQPERALGLIQAAYRGVQDTRSAIRYFKNDAQTYGVDTSRITVWGVGTGGYIALGTAYLNSFTNIAQTTNPPFKFLLDINGDDTPDITMVNEIEFGNINGTSEGTSLGANGVTGTPEGNTINAPSNVDISSDFQLVVNMAGALGDISWMDAGDVPLISYQVPTDPFAPYDDDVLVVPTTDDRIVQVQGGLATTRKAVELGLNQAFIDANIDDEFTTAAKAASATAGHEYVEGLYPFIRPTNILGNEEGDPWQWWDREFWSTVTINDTSSITWDQASLPNNPDASPEKARLYIDSIMGYFAPRAVAALGLQEVVSSVPVLSDQEVGLQLAPNPASQFVTIQSNAKNPILGVQLFDLKGSVVGGSANIKDQYYRLNRNNLPRGIYMAKIRFDKGILTKKVVFD